MPAIEQVEYEKKIYNHERLRAIHNSYGWLAIGINKRRNS